MSKYRQTMAESYGSVVENSATAMQIANLKKAYEPMRNKRISMEAGNKLMKMFDKFDSNKELLKQMYKADIPFVSGLASARLISKHGLKAQQLMQIRKEDLDIRIDEVKQINELREQELEDFEEDLLGEDINEARMKDIYTMQQDGKSAEEIAKVMKLPVKTVKGILGEELDEAVGHFQKFMITYGKPGGDAMVYYTDYMQDLQNRAQEYRKKGYIIGKMGRSQPLNQLPKKMPMKGKDIKEEMDKLEINEGAMDAKQFDSLKTGQELTITYNSTMSGTTVKKFVVKSKSRSAKHNVDKVKLEIKGQPGRVPFYLYKRANGNVSLAMGDMAATLVSVKEWMGEMFTVQITKKNGGQIVHGSYKTKPEAEKFIKWYKTGPMSDVKSVEVIKEEGEGASTAKVPAIDKDNKPGVKIAKIRLKRDKMDGEGAEGKDAVAKKEDEVAMLKQKLETEKQKNIQKATQKLINPETGEPLLQVGIAYKHLADKKEKEADKKEEEKKDEVKEDNDYLQSKLNSTQIANIKNTWKNKKASDVTQSVKDMLKKMDIPTQLAIKHAKIPHLSNLIEEITDAESEIIEGKYTRYSDLLIQKGRMQQAGDKQGERNTDAEIKKEKQKLGINEDAESDKAYAIGMAKAKEKYNDEPPLEKKTIKKGHEIADKILNKEHDSKQTFERLWLKHKRGDKR